jgi:hypothetical protein
VSHAIGLVPARARRFTVTCLFSESLCSKAKVLPFELPGHE